MQPGRRKRRENIVERERETRKWCNEKERKRVERRERRHVAENVH
jgi:hypothetical protein